MTAGKYNVKIECGATFSKTVVWNRNDAPVNLTTYTARMHIRPCAGSSILLLSLTTENGRISLNASGQILLTIAASVTETLEPGFYFYDLELVNSDVVTRLLEGSAEVIGEVSA